MEKNIQLRRKPNTMSKVNLDALIPREDFMYDGVASTNIEKPDKLSTLHLVTREFSFHSLYTLLKKPDFQRETNEWDKRRIAELIDCFINGRFIPAVILWQHPETRLIYVIDGSHRLSALIAYFNDDYGDGAISREFYNNQIPQAELDLADETRQYINKKCGSYLDNMKRPADDQKVIGINMNQLHVQYVGGNVKHAEDSFFKINQQGVTLSPVEKSLCKSRALASCIATRIIIRGGAGSQYWNKFTDNQQMIKAVAEDLNKLLFLPPYQENFKSIFMSHPLCGNPITATPVVFEMIKMLISNRSTQEEKDTTGAKTLSLLVSIRKIIHSILSEQPGSYGLFPSVYFYNSTGKFIQSAFLGMVQLFMEKPKDDTFWNDFIKIRGKLEDFLIENKIFLVQINRKYGSKAKSYKHQKEFFETLIGLLAKDEEDIIKKLKSKYDFLNPDESEIEKPVPKKAPQEVKAYNSLSEELQGVPRCKICKGLLHPLSKSHDHKLDIKYGGVGEPSNLQTTHIYCNMSKDKLISLGIYKE